ncbi:hypothetical protein [Salirhabdus salicampi]|uniref:hypothetical protein n=1 Tax=Salirhabdus salicampi TaxID=476102 RepID=UPI0020C2FD27|nr:hypothetical protein [Salirhabdus salicampi]MCP8616373.1 hypothetical protein [Salirhabdus salicampi]
MSQKTKTDSNQSTNVNDVFDETEENLYIEFQKIVEHLSQEITRNVMASIVSTPLDEIYKKYETYIPKLENSTEKIKIVSDQMLETKQDLYQNISKLILEVSNRTIEDTVFTKLESIKNEYEKQLPLMDKNSNELQKLIKKIQDTKVELFNNTKSIIGEVSNKVIEEEVLKKFDELYKQYEVQLPKVIETNDHIDKLIIELNEARKKIYSNVNDLYDSLSDKIVDTVNEKLNVIYQKYSKKVEELDQKHESLQEVNRELNNTKVELRRNVNNYKSEIGAMKKDIELLQNNTNKLRESLEEKLDFQNKIIIGLGIVVIISLVI